MADGGDLLRRADLSCCLVDTSLAPPPQDVLGPVAWLEMHRSQRDHNRAQLGGFRSCRLHHTWSYGGLAAAGLCTAAAHALLPPAALLRLPWLGLQAVPAAAALASRRVGGRGMVKDAAWWQQAWRQHPSLHLASLQATKVGSEVLSLQPSSLPLGLLLPAPTTCAATRWACPAPPAGSLDGSYFGCQAQVTALVALSVNHGRKPEQPAGAQHMLQLTRVGGLGAGWL